MCGARLWRTAPLTLAMLAFGLGGTLRALAEDCNHNGVSDDVDISSGASTDCDGNGVPDDCDLIAAGPVLHLYDDSGDPPEIEDVNPRIATDGQGRWIAVWTHAITQSVYLARSADGHSWSAAEVLVPAGAEGNRDPVIATNGCGRWIVVWRRGVEYAHKLYYVRSDDDGISWTNPAALHPTIAGDNWDPAIVFGHASTALVVFATRSTINGVDSGPDYEIAYARSTDGGITFPELGFVNQAYAATNSDEDFLPDVATDAQGNWIAVWRSQHTQIEYPDPITLPSGRHIFYAVGTDSGLPGGLSWSPHGALGIEGQLGARIATDRQGRWVATLVADTSGSTRFSTDLGANWSPSFVLPSGFQPGPVMFDGLSNWVLVGRDPSVGILGMLSRNYGESWEPSAAIEIDSDCVGSAPSIATDGAGGWVSTWYARTCSSGGYGTDADIFVTPFCTASGTYYLNVGVLPAWAGSTDPNVGVSSRPADQLVTLTASPVEGFAFDHWETDPNGPFGDRYAASTTILMDRNRRVTATFGEDCDENGIVDIRDIADCLGDPGCSDCNGNGVLDLCDIANGTSRDTNNNGVPDSCEFPDDVLFVDTAAAGASDGSSWRDAYVDLQDALDDAAGSVEPISAIWVAAGTYTPDRGTGNRAASFTLQNDLAIVGGFSGTETHPDQRDLTLHETILSGDLNGDDRSAFVNTSENAYHVVRSPGLNRTAVLDGLTISSGNADTAPDNAGGGIIIFSSGPTVSNCVIRANLADFGAGVFVEKYGNPLFEHCRFERNRAMEGGGGLFAGDCVQGPSGIEIVTCEFLQNDVAIGAGGGIRGSCADLTIWNSMFFGNVVSRNRGGAIYAVGGNVELDGCVVVANRSDRGEGGVALLGSSSTITNSVFWGNFDPRGFIDLAQLGPMGSGANIYNCLIQGLTTAIPGPGQGQDNFDQYAGLTPDWHLRQDSICIDRGMVTSNVEDRDGETRGVGAAFDVGADEFVSTLGGPLPDSWLARHFDPNQSPDPNGDDDQDGLNTRSEYELFSSSPTAPPWFVDEANGDDAYDGKTASADPNGLHGPKRSIQAALDEARHGDTILVLPGDYAGVGDHNLDFHGQSVVVRASGGPEVTTIDCGGDGRAVDPNSIAAASAALSGFTLEGGAANRGGAVRAVNSRLFLHDCVIENNTATTDAGGYFVRAGSPAVDGLVIRSNSSPNGYTAVLTASAVRLEGELRLSEGTTVLRSCWLDGAGQIVIDPNATLRIVGDTVGAPASVIRSDIHGRGEIVIDVGQTLRVENGALVDLSSDDPNVGCADPEGSANWGSIIIDGALLVRDATIRNTNVDVKLAEFEDGPTILNNDIRLLESSAGFGGEFFVAGSSIVQCNVIRSEGDRYLDLDPDPSAEPRPLVTDNLFFVTITQGKGLAQGELLELRSKDRDPNIGGGASGAHPLASSAGYSDTWVLQRLEVVADARVNLTNRRGFVFQDPNVATHEVVYVKQLKLYPGAVLNTGLQRLYYQELVDENDQPLASPDPNDPEGWLANGARIVDVPLLGFSLKTIAMEDDTEFDVRVRQRLEDSSDLQPEPPSPRLQGSVTRLDDPDTLGLGGVMEMRTKLSGHPSASSVAAKGVFARAGDEDITIGFDYLFRQDTGDPGKPLKLIVYLSDSPRVSESLFEVARVYPPMPGEAGSIGSSQMATFFATFPRGNLNFKRGTYVDLELRGENTVVWIDNFDPQVECSYTCADLDGSNSVDAIDYLIAVSSAERVLEADDIRGCLDSKLTGDRYVDLQDLLAWDGYLNGSALNPCGDGLGLENREDPDPIVLPAGTELLVAGKPAIQGDQGDYLYAFDSSLDCLGPALRPASSPDVVFGYRSNGRLIADGDGSLYQVHATQGLVRLDDAQVLIAPGAPKLAGVTVYIGVTELGGPEGEFVGLPLSDVAFDPTDPTTAYVVPVVVESADFDPNQPYRYKAAARLILAGDGSYSVTEIYGLDPQQDPEQNTDPPGGSVINVQSQREIEVDDQGNVYVLSANAINENDWLLLYDASDGSSETRIRVSAEVIAPTALLVSQVTADTLYVAAGADEQPGAGTTIWQYPITRSGGLATGLGAPQTKEIAPPATVDPNSADIGLVTALAEDPTDGTVYVSGLVMPRYGEAYQFQPGDPLFTQATLATFTPGASGPFPSQELGCNNLALPISLAVVGGTPIPCVGDLDDDRDVDLTDLAVLLSDFDCTSGCVGDVDGDDDTDLTDLAVLLANFDAICP